MSLTSKQPTAVGEVLLGRLEVLSLSLAEVERRTLLSKNTISNVIYGPRQPQRKTIETLAAVLDLDIEALTRPGLAPMDGVRFERFWVWLFRTNNLSLWISVLGALVTALFLWEGFSEGRLSPAVQGVHCLVILLLLMRLPRSWVRPQVWADAYPQLRVALAAAGDLRRCWGAVWMAWLFLYLALTVASVVGVLPSGESLAPSARWLAVGLNLVQNCASVMLFLAYETVARPTIQSDLSRKQVLPLEAWLVFALLLPILEGWVVASGLSWSYQLWFGWISGFGQGTALALLVGRLDSKYIDPPALVVALLYVYAAIQGAWPAVQSHYELLLSLTFLALVLKCLLFLFIAWLFESRVVLYYLEQVRELDLGVREQRIQFLQKIQSRD